MIKKKHRKLFFKEDFKKIIGKKTRFENVNDIFNDAEQNNKRIKGINIDDVEHALSRKRMYSVSKHYTGNARMYVSRAKALKMHKIAYGKKSKRKDAEYLYQELKLTNKSTKAVVISNFLSSKSLETIYNIRLKRGRGYSLPPHVKTTMNSVVGAEKHKGIKLRLWNPLKKERTTIDASKVSTVPGTNTDLKLNIGDKIARKTKQKRRPITLIEEREIWKNAMALINKEKIDKSSGLYWSAINDEIADAHTRCMNMKDTPLEQGIHASPGRGWKSVIYHGQRIDVHRGPGKPAFGKEKRTKMWRGGIREYKKWMKNIAKDHGYEGMSDQQFIDQLPLSGSRSDWKFYVTETPAYKNSVLKSGIDRGWDDSYDYTRLVERGDVDEDTSWVTKRDPDPRLQDAFAREMHIKRESDAFLNIGDKGYLEHREKKTERLANDGLNEQSIVYSDKWWKMAKKLGDLHKQTRNGIIHDEKTLKEMDEIRKFLYEDETQWHLGEVGGMSIYGGLTLSELKKKKREQFFINQNKKKNAKK